jgi:PAS domain S-box-containing protein
MNDFAGTTPVAHLRSDGLDKSLLELPEQLWDLLPAAVYVCDSDGILRRFNRRAAELWGRTPQPGEPTERFCGSYRIYRLDGGPVPHAECAMNDVLRTGVPVRDLEIVFERPDSSRMVALVNIAAIKDGVGNIIGAINCFLDITERKRAEAALRENERQSRMLLDVLPAALYMTDADGKVTYYNKAAVELAGREPELGSDEWCITWKLYWPDGTLLPHAKCPMAAALKENRPIRGLEAVAERPDGTRVPIVPYPTPLYDASGSLVGAVNMVIDISDRKRAEDIALRLALIVESSDDAIYSQDLNGIITSWNKGAERLYGYMAEEIIGVSIKVLIPPAQQNEEDTILERLGRDERIQNYETIRQRKGGGFVDISLTVSPIRGGQGQIIGVSKIARDITERKRSERQITILAREAEHRTKNILATVQATVHLTQSNTPDGLKKAIAGRIQALANAHSLFAQSRWTGADLRSLVTQELMPYRLDGVERALIDGPSIMLETTTAQTIAVALHELATNAAKYGALSVPAGRIHVAWSRAADGELTLHWAEVGGPSVKPPTRQGFGTRVMNGMIRGQLKGEMRLDWRPDGLMCEIVLPT